MNYTVNTAINRL